MPSNEKRGETRVSILGQTVRFGIIEKVREAPQKLEAEQRILRYEPTGQLSIQVLSHTDFFKRIWRDKESKPVEDSIPECVAAMMKIGSRSSLIQETAKFRQLDRKSDQRKYTTPPFRVKTST